MVYQNFDESMPNYTNVSPNEILFYINFDNEEVIS
jgi:hypothetical protein